MTPIVPIAGTLTPADPAARLKKAAHEFEAVFLSQMFREMRATVETPGGQAEEMYQSMLDDTVASEAAARSTRGLGEALYRQLASRLGAEHGPDRSTP